MYSLYPYLSHVAAEGREGVDGIRLKNILIKLETEIKIFYFSFQQRELLKFDFDTLVKPTVSKHDACIWSKRLPDLAVCSRFFLRAVTLFSCL